MRGLAGTIPWATLTEAERQGALMLVYEQDSDLALVALRDGTGTNLGSIHATSASMHPVIATALAGELTKLSEHHAGQTRAAARRRAVRRGGQSVLLGSRTSCSCDVAAQQIGVAHTCPS